MTITKILSQVEIQINPEQGKIWINAPNCILRIQGLDFKNKREKFSMIDINESKASMIEGNLVTSGIQSFMDEVISVINNHDFTKDQQKEILELISNMKRGK